MSGITSNFGIQKQTFEKLFRKTKQMYNRKRNPYHNFSHGLTVLNTAFHFLIAPVIQELENCFRDVGTAALLYGTLMHDIDHPGRNNIFEMNSFSKLAVRYSDSSVLESHHCARAFQLLEDPQTNIFSLMKPDKFINFRKFFIKGILSTDSKFHVEHITAFT